MSQLFHIHPDNPQSRLIRQAVAIMQDDGVIVYPTDSGYAIGCQLGNKRGLDRIRAIRQLSDNHHFTLVCRDLSELGNYALVDNSAFRILKANTPGPYTFILKATEEVPRRLQHPKRKTIGLRVPDHTVALSLLEAHNEPLMSATLILPGHNLPMMEPEAIRDVLGKQVDLIIDGGSCGPEPTTVVSLIDEQPEIIRRGGGDITPFEQPLL